MDNSDIIYADPWHKKGEKNASLPDDARFACAYQVFESIEFFDHPVFFRRTESADELWTGVTEALLATGTSPEDYEREKLSSVWCAFAVRRKGEELTACLRLMELFIRAQHDFVSFEKFLVSGIVDKSSYDSLLKRVEDEYEENTRKAQERETEIIKVARELRLFPYPAGTGPDYWRARCPRWRKHPIYINAAMNSFGCGWCKRKGGIEELRAFVQECKTASK